jgi:flagellin
MLTINTNINSLTAQAAMASTMNGLQTAMQRLSTGLRVNSAADDPSGQATDQRMTAQVNGMNQAIQNANDGISMTQTADTALSSVGDALQRMRELAVEARNSTNSSADRDSLNQEFTQLGAEIQRELGGTSFNGTDILGQGAGALVFQVGADSRADQMVTVTTPNLTTDATIGAATGTSIGGTMDFAGLGSVIGAIDSAIDEINTQRSNLGAVQNRFSAALTGLQSTVVDQSAGQSQIMDANYAAETSNMSRDQILQQVGLAMIAQANQMPQQVFNLLGK